MGRWGRWGRWGGWGRWIGKDRKLEGFYFFLSFSICLSFCHLSSFTFHLSSFVFRPRALVLANGALVISGGRPALNLWVSQDGFGKSWETYDIPTVHNRGVTDPSLAFCPEFLNATSAIGWEQSSGYTQLGALSTETGLVCYQRQLFRYRAVR